MKNFILALSILGGSLCFAQGSAKSELPLSEKIIKQYDLQGNCVADYLENESLCKALAVQLESTLKLPSDEKNTANKDLKDLYTKAKLIAYAKGDYFSALKYLEKEQAMEAQKPSSLLRPDIEKAYLETIIELGSRENDRFKKELENNLSQNLISTSLEAIEKEIESPLTGSIIPPGKFRKINNKTGTQVNKEVRLHKTPEPHAFQVIASKMEQEVLIAHYEEIYKPVIDRIRKQILKYQN